MARTLRVILLALLLVAVGSSAAWTANGAQVKDILIKDWGAWAAAADKLPVEIRAVMTDESGGGTFDVNGDGAARLCPSGTLESTNTRIKWLSEDSFKIWQDKVLTCDDTEQVFVLELKNTILLGEGGVPGKGTWKLKTSIGFDPAPTGKGDIVWVDSPPGTLAEAYVGLIK